MLPFLQAFPLGRVRMRRSTEHPDSAEPPGSTFFPSLTGTIQSSDCQVMGTLQVSDENDAPVQTQGGWITGQSLDEWELSAVRCRLLV